jgi:serine/threonine protein phosphatase PrpC
MNFLVETHTDVGINKSTNQDSLLLKVAKTNYGNICFVAICDGMGGLSKGELASATMIRVLADWFDHELPFMLGDFEQIKKRFSSIIAEQNGKIANYGKSIGANLGTTLTAMLFVNSKYLIVNVGDTRAYEISDKIKALTKDQTVVAREIERGNLTPEEAEKDPRRNVLLQCIGASSVAIPDFYESYIKENAVYMLCSDGFRHEITADEIYTAFDPNKMTVEKIIKQKAIELVELCKARQEIDNITVAVIKIV